MINDVMQFLPWMTVLVIFFGMMLLVWRALGIAHDLAKLALQGAQVSAPRVPPALPPVAAPPAPLAKPTSNAITQGFVNFVKKEEGFRAKAYWDYKQWSIGYGTRATSSAEVIDETEGERRLRVEITKADAMVTSFAPNLPEGVHQALVDLTYNAGSGWEHQSLGAAVKAEKWDTVKADILQYNHAGGQVNAGLTARREAEIKWFDNPL